MSDNNNSQNEKVDNDSIIVSKKELRIILDRLGKQYMTQEAQKIVNKLYKELSGK